VSMWLLIPLLFTLFPQAFVMIGDNQATYAKLKFTPG